MGRKKFIILIAIVIILIISGVILFGNYSQPQIKEIENNFSGQEQQVNNEISLTRSEVPENTIIPEVGEKISEDIAAPTLVSAAAPGISAKLRVFDIKASDDYFQPSTLIVKLGDNVKINFTAVDKKYDITFPDYGMKQEADKGQTKALGFQAVVEGKFTYYCSLCGGLESKAVGYIIVAP